MTKLISLGFLSLFLATNLYAATLASVTSTSKDGSCSLQVYNDCTLTFVDGHPGPNSSDFICVYVSKLDSHGNTTSVAGWFPSSALPLKQGTKVKYSGSDEDSFGANSQMKYDGKYLSIKTRYQVDELTDNHGLTMKIETDDAFKDIKSVSVNKYRISSLFGQKIDCSF
jgi:hypothetical protein